MKEQSKKETKEYIVDIRKLPKGKRFNISGILTIIGISVILSLSLYVFRVLNTKGEEVAVSQIVTDITEKKYEKILLKDDMVIVEYKGEVEGKETVLKKYALLPAGTNFYEVLASSGINIKDLENDFYEPKLGITFGDVLTFIFLSAGLVLV